MTRAERQQEWETLIAAYRTSGQSAKEWCAANDVKPEQLWYRLRRDSTRKTGQVMKPFRWLPVEVSGPAPRGHEDALLVRVGEACIEVKSGFDPDLLSGIVRVLLTLC